MEAAARGVRQLAHGDITGHRAVTARQQAEENAQAVDRAVLELRDPDTQLSGFRSPDAVPAIHPKEVFEALKRR